LTKKPFIFVTVGSTDFDALVEAVDNLAPSLQARGVLQIGHGRYIPAHMPYFRFAPSLDPYYEQASLVIAHGGLATTMEALKRGLPLVSVSNPDRYDDHQQDLLSMMAEEGYLIWCRQLDVLGQAIETLQTAPLRRYQPPECEIHLVIDEFLGKSERRGDPGVRMVGSQDLEERIGK
jgi:UDP-N-acetylglucosamine transferase subunit ALG13